MKKINNELYLVLIPLGIGLNFGLATIVTLLKAPIYLDAIGTIIITILLGWRAGIITGILSFVLMTVTGIGPYHIYFSGTQAAIALFIYFMAKRHFLSNIFRVVITGILLGIVAAIFSAPVIVFLFGGVEGNGPGLITAFLIKTGNTITESVILKGISIEPIDKTIQCLLSYFLIKGIPSTILKKFNSGLLTKNFIK